MLVKTFQAVSMSEALQMVKAELGSDAMIISSRKERRKGILGFFRKPVFEITATVDKSPLPKRDTNNPYVKAREEGASTREEFQKSMLEPLVRELRELKDRVDSINPRQAKNLANEVIPSANASSVADKGGRGNGFIPMSNGRPDMDKIRELLIETVAAKSTKNAAIAKETPAENITVDTIKDEYATTGISASTHMNLSNELKGTGMDLALCEKLIESAGSVSAEDEAGARVIIRETLAGMIRCSGVARLKKNGPRMIALVGPTGVGKTTTIAKLAAMYTLKKKVKVALVTTDIFRAGAVEQLKTYANVLRVPMETASTKKELEKAMEAHSDKDIILIDTAGKSSRDCGKLDELSGLLNGDSGIEKHLCLSATTRDEDLQDIVSQFKTLTVQRVLFTKLDESRKLGCIANVSLRNNLPLSYITNGQRVPEDIEAASGKKVAQMVLGA